MSAVPHPEPYTVNELYALPDDGMRHELLDGTLLVSPPPSVPHQLSAGRLVALMAEAAPADVEVLEAVGVEVPSGLLVPDVVVARAAAVHRARRSLSARDVLAVVEIVSPSSRTADRRWKAEVYAEAGIDGYWLVELEGSGAPEIIALERSGTRWVERARASAGDSTPIPLPFPVTIDPACLRGAPRRHRA